MAVPGRKAPKGQSQEDFQLFCCPCDRDGSRLQTYGFCQDCEEHLCESCYKYHRQSKPCKDHVLLDKQHMPLTHMSPSSSTPTGCTIPCPKHSNKMLEFFCQNHQLVVCYICSTLGHRTCHLDYIPDISQEYIESKDYQYKTERLDSLLQLCDQTYDIAEEKIKDVAESSDNVLQEIDQFRRQVNEALDRRQRHHEQKVEEVKKRDVDKLTSITESCSSLKMKISSLQSRLGQLKTSNETCHLFVELMQAQSCLDEYESLVQEHRSTEATLTVSFKSNGKLASLVQSDNNLGEICFVTRTITGSTENKIKSAEKTIKSTEETIKSTDKTTKSEQKATFIQDINVHSINDKTNCWITGITKLSPDVIAVADYNNKSLKTVDVRTGAVQSWLAMPSNPWDVTALPGNQIAVTLPKKNCIQFVSTSTYLKKLKTIKVSGSCYGIAYGRGRLAVTLHTPNKYQILNLEGTVLFSSSQDLNLSDRTNSVDISTDENYFFVCDGGYFTNNRVLQCDWLGNICGIYEDPDFRDLRGVSSRQDVIRWVQEGRVGGAEGRRDSEPICLMLQRGQWSNVVRQ